MRSRWTRIRTWAGLDMISRSGPVPWRTAARAWVVVYLLPTCTLGGFLLVVGALMGYDAHFDGRFVAAVAPFLGAGTYMGQLAAMQGPARSAPPAPRRTLSPRVAAVLGWAVGVAAMFSVDSVRNGRTLPVPVTLMISVGATTVMCAVFVVVTHVRRLPSTARPDPR